MKQYTIKLLLVVACSLLSCFIVLTAQAGGSTQWVKKSKSVAGGWSIEHKDGGVYWVLDEHFKTSKGPDLKLMLSKLSSQQVNGRNASDGSLTIAPLRSTQGKQSYKLPENYADYRTLLIHCEKCSKLWSASDLSSE